MSPLAIPHRRRALVRRQARLCAEGPRPCRARLPLVGGRVDYFDGRRVAAIVFRRRDHVINVFIMPHASGPMRHEELRRNGYNIESWSDGEYDFWAVSDLNRDELDMLTKLLGA